MRSPPASLLAVAAAAFVLVNPNALPADDNPLPRSTATLTTARPPPGVTLNFPGGTLAQLIAALANSGSNFNLIGEPGDLSATIPPLSVRNANTFAFAQALDSLLQADALTLGGDWSSNVFTVEKRPADEKGASGTLTQSCQLSPELKLQPIDAIVDAIRSAWALDPAHDPKALRLQFHPATRLLLISGPPEGVRIALNVIRHLSVPPPEDESSERLPAPALGHR
jgi:hypothetical protein